MELSGYALEPLRKDEEFILYRGHSKQAEAPSVLLLAPVSLRPALETLKKIEHEYSFRNELDATWAVRPITLSHYNEQRVLVLEDPGGEPLNRLIHGPMEMKQVLRFAIGLATALGQLHKRELIHKDVKPSNVLVDPRTGQVWLMGFGITSRLPREHQSPEPPEFIAGTLPYMAPEQTGRMNRSIDSRKADIAALESLFAEDVVSTSDGGGIVRAARVPVVGRERVAKFTATAAHFWQGVTLAWVETNGQAAVLVSRDGVPVALTTIDASEQGIDQIVWILRPSKLAAISKSGQGLSEGYAPGPAAA